MVAFGLEDSDLVFRTAFPILLGNLVQSLQPEEKDTARALPGPGESQLKVTAPVPEKKPAAPEPGRQGWWTTFPLWWWALILGTLWLLAEGWSYSRRITE